jgi:hypothetical protein
MTFFKNSAESQYLTSYDDFIAGLIPNDLVLELEYESDAVSEGAFFCVTFNDTVIKKISLTEEKSKICLNLIPTKGHQVLELSMSAKGPNDTLVQNDVIVKDTFLKLTDLKINNYKLLDDYEFFYNKTVYIRHSDNEKIYPSNGFWQNATLKITFDLPFDLWYNNISTKNAVLSESLKFRTTKNDLELLVEDLEQSLKKLI